LNYLNACQSGDTADTGFIRAEERRMVIETGFIKRALKPASAQLVLM
jgi:hypothetical protein